MKLFGKKDQASTVPTGNVTNQLIGDKVMSVRINNPPDNVFTESVIEGLTEVFEAASSRDDVHCILLASEGTSFSVGPSLRQMEGYNSADALVYWRRGKHLTDLIECAKQPVVCAIQGDCKSVGLAVALACDIRIASGNARFSFPDINHLDLVPGWGATQRLTHIVGSQHAKYMLITGKTMSSEFAMSSGLVHRVVKPEQLVGESRELAYSIAKHSLKALTHCKNAINAGIDVEYGTAMHIEEQAFMATWDVEGRKEIIGNTLRQAGK